MIINNGKIIFDIFAPCSINYQLSKLSLLVREMYTFHGTTITITITIPIQTKSTNLPSTINHLPFLPFLQITRY